MTFQYLPTDCTGTNAQAAACGGDLTNAVGAATLTAEGHNQATWTVAGSPVANFRSVVFTAGANGKWPNELGLTIDPGDGDDPPQTLQIHTSCSQPFVLGDVFGSMILTDMNPEALGPSMQHDLYDLTIGAEGPTGSQGPQGKPGSNGPTGSQGPQGKPGSNGSNGSQGPQGKPGADGSDGSQGPQGKPGSDGSNGSQGPQGKPGQDGNNGVETNLMCFGTDQTIGSQGKYMGLGQQGGEHDLVSIISPFGANAEVITLIVKVAQGNSPRDGIARLFHDDPTDAGLQLGGDCLLTAAPSRSICTVLVNGGIGVFDSLSVFVVTSNGSFEGASACVLIDPDSTD